MDTIPAPSCPGAATSRLSDGLPMLTKAKETPTTSAQIRNETMVGNTRKRASSGIGAASTPMKCIVQIPTARKAAAPASSRRRPKPRVARTRAARPKPV